MWNIFLRMAAAGASIFASAEVLKFLSRDQNYADVISKITDEINYADCVAKKKTETGIGISCDVYRPKVYSEERVKVILNTYIQAVLDNVSLPEYDAINSEHLQASAPTIAEVAVKAGERDEATVRTVLGQLFWSTEQNRVHDTSFIRPRTARNNAQYRATPDQYKDQDKSFLDKTADSLASIGTIVVGAAIFVGGIMVYHELKD